MSTKRRNQRSLPGGFPRQVLQWAAVAILVIIALLVPTFLESYGLHVMIIAFWYAVLSSSWSLLAGYAGQFSFAHVAFTAIGAYTTGMLGMHFDWPPLVGIVSGVLMAGVVGLAIGALVLRFKPAYLALFTIAFSEILRLLIRGEPQLTRGDHGLRLDPLLRLDVTSRVPHYYIMLAILVGCLFLMHWLVSSRIGLFLRAIREDEEAAAARGVDVVRYKVFAFAITSMIAGLAGAFYGHYTTILSPNMLVLTQMGLVMSMAIIGGVENLIAAAFGGILIQVGLELLREFGPWRLVIFGALLMIMLRFARNGLLTPLFRLLFDHGPQAEMQEGTGAAAEEAAPVAEEVTADGA
ncbi:MAG: branched-chain amino acid ABC transporter permease [Anaerolineae bacterium]